MLFCLEEQRQSSVVAAKSVLPILPEHHCQHHDCIFNVLSPNTHMDGAFLPAVAATTLPLGSRDSLCPPCCTGVHSTAHLDRYLHEIRAASTHSRARAELLSNHRGLPRLSQAHSPLLLGGVGQVSAALAVLGLLISSLFMEKVLFYIPDIWVLGHRSNCQI